MRISELEPFQDYEVTLQLKDGEVMRARVAFVDLEYEDIIVDVLGTLDRLPFQLKARSEFEYVGQKPLGDGFVAVPVKEFRAAVLRSLHNQRIDLGLNLLVACGYTGQTTEFLALPGDAEPFERVVGVRLRSYAGIAFSYHF